MCNYDNAHFVSKYILHFNHKARRVVNLTLLRQNKTLKFNFRTIKTQFIANYILDIIAMNKNNKQNKATKSKQVIRRVKQIIQDKSETKITDILYSNTMGSSAYLYDVLQISQGSGSVNNRVGLSVDPFRFQCICTFGATYALTGQNFNNIRVILFRDLQQKDSNIPVTTDVLSVSSVVAAYNFFNKKRFKIYYDRIHTINYYDPSTTLKLDVKLAGETRYSGISSATINKNGLYIIFLEDNSSNPATFNFWSRVHFKDA